MEKYAILVEPGGAIGSETYIRFSFKAHQAAATRKCNSHQKYLLRNCPRLRGLVLEKLKQGWSPPADLRKTQGGN
jgi:hypothetical protein